MRLYLQFVLCALNVVSFSCFFALISSRSSWSEDGSSVGLVEKKRSSIPLRSKSIITYFPRIFHSHSSPYCLKLKDNLRKFRGWIIGLFICDTPFTSATFPEIQSYKLKLFTLKHYRNVCCYSCKYS